MVRRSVTIASRARWGPAPLVRSTVWQGGRSLRKIESAFKGRPGFRVSRNGITGEAEATLRKDPRARRIQIQALYI